MSERNRWKGRSELGFLPARSLLLLIYIESFVAPTSLCIFNLSELVWALRQQVVEKHSFNLQHMFRTTCLLPVLAQCCVIGMCCKILSCRLGLALRRGLGLLPCMCDQKLLALHISYCSIVDRLRIGGDMPVTSSFWDLNKPSSRQLSGFSLIQLWYKFAIPMNTCLQHISMH